MSSKVSSPKGTVVKLKTLKVKYTPIKELLDSLRLDFPEMEEMAVCYQLKDGTIRTGWSTMSYSSILYLATVLHQRAIQEMHG